MAGFDKHIHVDSIIERIHRDFELSQFSRDDASEWAWECLGKIGSENLMKDKFCILQVSGYRAMLPEDFMKLLSVRTYIDKVVLTQTSYEFWKDYRGYTTESKTIDDGVNSFTVVSDDYNNWESPANQQIGTFQTAGTTFETSGTNHGYSHGGDKVDRLRYVFKIVDDYIYTGLQSVAIEIAYKAIPVYNDYTPMIPDDERVKYAVETTIVYKLLQREWVKGNVSLQMKREFEPEYLFAIASARNKTIEPNEEDWEQMKNRAMAIIKSHKGHDNSYSIWGARQNGYLNKSI